MFQSVTAIGRIGKEPVSNQAGQTNVTKFSIACSEKWKDKSGNMQESTEWFNCVAYGKLGDICMNLKKGSLAFVVGKMKTRSWEKDDKKFYATELIVDTLKFLDQKKNDGPAPSNDITTDDLLF